MKVIDNLSINTEIPFKSISGFRFHWLLDNHAVMKVSGILDSSSIEDMIKRNFKGSKLSIEYDTKTIFYGLVKTMNIASEGGLYTVDVEVISASYRLDMNPLSEMFQDCSITYKQMIRYLVLKESGNVICTVGEKKIDAPLLCYQETLWDYAKRMASHFQSHVIPDIKTGVPAFWFGFRAGKKVENHELTCEKVVIRKPIRRLEEIREVYCLSGNRDYQLGDKLLINNDWQVIFEKEVCMERGEITFSYLAAKEHSLSQQSYHPKKMTGLSLKGTVEKIEKEQVYISLDIDGKPGTYPFPWYPETGTGLYAMPEIGSKVELYFMDADSRNAFAIRCRDTKSTDKDVKRLEIPNGAQISIDSSSILFEKDDLLHILDGNIDITGKKELEISAASKVRISGKIIEIYAKDRIEYVTDM